MPPFAAIAGFFLRTPIGRAIGIAALSLALLAGLRWHWRGEGARDERERIGTQEIEPLKKQMESARAEFATDLKAERDKSAQKDVIIEKQTELIARLDARIADYDRQRAQQAQNIARMSDTEVFQDLTRRLGVRDAKDAAPQLYPGEIRKADTLLADAEIQARKLADVETKVDAQAKKYDALAEKQGSTERQLQLALTYIDRADARFAEAYNVFQRTHPRPLWQKVLSFGLLRDRKITEVKPIVKPERPEGLKP